MGCWGTGIMEGDVSLDYQCYIHKWLEQPMDYDEDFSKIKFSKALEKGQCDMLDKIKKEAYEDFIGLQVLGYLIVTYGVKIEEKVREAVLDGIRRDDWRDDSERDTVMSNFKEIIENYNGQKVIIKQTGLFETIYNSLNSKKLEND